MSIQISEYWHLKDSSQGDLVAVRLAEGRKVQGSIPDGIRWFMTTVRILVEQNSLRPLLSAIVLTRPPKYWP